MTEGFPISHESGEIREGKVNEESTYLIKYDDVGRGDGEEGGSLARSGNGEGGIGRRGDII